MKTNQEHSSSLLPKQQGVQPAAAEPALSTRRPYVPPIVEVLSFKMEKGFAISSGPSPIPGRGW